MSPRWRERPGARSGHRVGTSALRGEAGRRQGQRAERAAGRLARVRAGWRLGPAGGRKRRARGWPRGTARTLAGSSGEVRGQARAQRVRSRGMDGCPRVSAHVRAVCVSLGESVCKPLRSRVAEPVGTCFVFVLRYKRPRSGGTWRDRPAWRSRAPLSGAPWVATWHRRPARLGARGAGVEVARGAVALEGQLSLCLGTFNLAGCCRKGQPGENSALSHPLGRLPVSRLRVPQRSQTQGPGPAADQKCQFGVSGADGNCSFQYAPSVSLGLQPEVPTVLDLAGIMGALRPGWGPR